MYRNRVPFREKLARFLYGRNGADTLYYVCIWSAFALAIVGMFWQSYTLSLLYLLLFGYAMFRFFSRNVYKRRAENNAFRRFFGRIPRFFSRRKQQSRDKEHVYKKCPSCKATLRLPRRKGQHSTRCPKCAQEFSVKIR